MFRICCQFYGINWFRSKGFLPASCQSSRDYWVAIGFFCVLLLLQRAGCWLSFIFSFKWTLHYRQFLCYGYLCLCILMFFLPHLLKSALPLICVVWFLIFYFYFYFQCKLANSKAMDGSIIISLTTLFPFF